MTAIDVYLEVGEKRTFAGAVDWPGWCRIGRDQDAALQSLVDYGPRYAQALSHARLGFHAPADVKAFEIVERLTGNMTTDFGAPDMAPAIDKQPVDDDDLQRFQTLLRAAWRALDAAVEAAVGKELRKGPRGGGRDSDGIIRHVLGAEAGYLARLAWKFKRNEDGDLDEERARTRTAVAEALEAAVHGELPAHGPRGGVIWTPRYFVRRVAWHILDHAWEIEDRAT